MALVNVLLLESLIEFSDGVLIKIQLVLCQTQFILLTKAFRILQKGDRNRIRGF